EVNRTPPLLQKLDPLRPLSPSDVVEVVGEGAWLIDGRAVEQWAEAHPRGAISIALRPQFASWLGWVVPFGEPVVLLIGEEQLGEALQLARRIGYDRVLGWLDGGVEAWASAGLPTASLEIVTAEEAGAQAGDGAKLLDVRLRSEWERS